MSERPRLVLWGAGGHAMVVADIVRLRGEFDLAGFIDDANPERLGQPFCGATVLGGHEALAGLHAAGCRHAFIAFGDSTARLRCAAVAARLGFSFPCAIHPAATVAADVRIGEGTAVMAGAVINPGCVVGCQAIVNTCASVDHECELGDGVHIAPSACLAGRVRVGAGTWIGLGALVKERTTIGAGCMVGAGSLVLEDVEAGATVWGSPAKCRRRKEPA